MLVAPRAQHQDLGPKLSGFQVHTVAGLGLRNQNDAQGVYLLSPSSHHTLALSAPATEMSAPQQQCHRYR